MYGTTEGVDVKYSANRQSQLIVCCYESHGYSWAALEEKYGQLTNAERVIPHITYLLRKIGKEKKARNAIDEARARAFAPGDAFGKTFFTLRYKKEVPMIRTEQIAWAEKKGSEQR
jgi:hypothetical protein